MPRRVGSVSPLLLLLAAVGPALGAPRAADAAPSVSLVPVTGGLSSPTVIANARDGSGRLFIVQQSGQIRVYAGGQILPTAFLNLESLISATGERGLLGLAFHPNYATNHAFYVYYTNTAGNIVIARYLVSADPNVADPASGVPLLTIPHPTYGNHNGGQLAFGPDGYLYAGVGDGGGGGDPDHNAQNVGVLLGKQLRIAVDGGPSYTIPPSNPFDGSPIWAFGLRNPWRFSFDRVTGDLFIADVGQNSREEIDFQPAGAPGGRNYCWPRFEGTQPYDGMPCTGGTPTPPILDYSHTLGCSVTGGYRYRGVVYPDMVGTYFYGDFCTGRLWGANNVGGTWSTTELLDTTLQFSTFGEDEAGEIYVADYVGGVIYRIVSQRPVSGVGVYRGTTGQWFLRNPDGGLTLVAWGAPAFRDVAVPADYDGDGQSDVAVYRATTGEWFIRRSIDGGLTHLAWGAPGLADVPVPGDYDGDHRADVAVYRQTTGEWLIQRSTDGGLTHLAWGAPGLADVPVPGDYDGDGRADIAVYRRSTGEWFIQRSSDGALLRIPWGAPFLGDTPAPADYDGDGRIDLAVYRTATGQWLIQRSTDLGVTVVAWGAPAFGDVPVPAQYDNDGHADIAVYRPPTGQWLIGHSSDGQLSVVSWGSAALDDVPLPRPPALR